MFHHLLAITLLFTFGAATTLATAKGLQDWAQSKFGWQISLDGYVAERPAGPQKHVQRWQ